MKRVLFVCLGNICRSPLAEGIFRSYVASLGRADAFEIDSAGTSGWHDGKPPHQGSVRVALRHGIDIRMQRSRKLLRNDFQRFDAIVVMDASNKADALALSPENADRVRMLGEFDPENPYADVPDPWGEDDAAYDHVFTMVSRCMPRLLRWLDTEQTPG